MALSLASMTTGQLRAFIAQFEKKADELRALNLKLDMARGKPSTEQTDLSRPLLDMLSSDMDLCDEGSRADNYGDPDGLPSARKLAAQIADTDPANVVVCGSSSLNLMHDVVCSAYTHGIGGHKPWCNQDEVIFLCPSPGYDRHFTVTERYGIKNVPIPFAENGPDMDVVREWVEKDPRVKGIWCVPRFSNPTGTTYSDEVVRAFARLQPAAPDFRIFWDDAYAVHAFAPGEEDTLRLSLFAALSEAGRTNLAYVFGSTAKVTFPSSGMAWVAASSDDMAELRRGFAARRVSPEKLLQLAHVRFLRDLDGVRAHMRKHAELLRPRFELVSQKLAEGLSELGCATWSEPRGGYFVCFTGPDGSASKIVALAQELGVVLTPAGAPWPYGNDPADATIRLAPTFPPLEELDRALDVFVVAASLVCARLELERR